MAKRKVKIVIVTTGQSEITEVTENFLDEKDVVVLEDGTTLLPGIPEPEPGKSLWDVSRTFKTSFDLGRSHIEAMEQERPSRHLGILTVTFSSPEKNIEADTHCEALEYGMSILDADVMQESEFASLYPGGEVYSR